MIKKLLNITLLTINVVVAVAMLVPACSLHLPPSECTFLSYFGLFFLPLLLLNVCFALFWVINLKYYALLPIAALLLAHGDIKASFSVFNSKQPEASSVGGRSIKVLTYNVMLFNYYDKKTPILDYINHSGADIVCLQEFGWHRNGKDFLSKEKVISSLTNYPYYHINIALDKDNVTYGIATFSKFPMVNKQLVDYESFFNSSIYSDITMGKDTVRVFNNHLESNRLTKQDKEKLSKEMNSEIISQTARKLSVAVAVRARQAGAVAAEIARSPHAVIVCGDFNDTPVSYVYKTIRGGLQDTFIGSGKGMGLTYSDGLYRFRIDYIFLNERFTYYGYEIDNVKYSDHYPVFCNVVME